MIVEVVLDVVGELAVTEVHASGDEERHLLEGATEGPL